MQEASTAEDLIQGGCSTAGRELWGLLQIVWAWPSSAAAFLVSPGNCGPSPLPFPIPLRCSGSGLRALSLLSYSSEGSLLSRAENLPSWSSISQHASLCESFKNAQLSQCTHSGSTWGLHSQLMCLCLLGPMALEVHFISSVYISLSLNRVKAYCH